MNDLQTTTGNQPSTLAEKIIAATDKLRPASESAIASAIIKLAGAGLAFPPGIKPDSAAQVYQFALRNVSIEALKATVIKIVQGELPGVRDFLPTPPALAAMVRTEERALWIARENLIAIKEAIEFKRPGGAKTEEEKARVRALVDKVKAQAAANRDADKNAFYDKPEDELNRIFKNKVDPPAAPPPAAGKWSDEAWFQQQEENDNGEKDIGSQRDAEALASGDTHGSGDRDQGNAGPFGFEDGGE